MTTRARVLPIALFALGAASCSLGGAQSPPAEAPAPPPVRIAATDEDVTRAVVDVGKEQVCAKLVDHFAPLQSPSSDGKSGGKSGGGDTSPSTNAGRWWIRTCRARADGDRLTVSLRGPLWLWIEKESSGFQLAQYIVFFADVTVTGTLDAAYDPAAEVVSVWFSPTVVPKVQGQPIVTPTPEPEGVGVLLNAVTLGNAQEIADEKARKKLAEELPRTFREQLEKGLTFVVELKTMQLGSAMRPLPPGEVPDRPFPNTRDTVMNERQSLHPSKRGYQIAGPYDPSPRLELDAVVQRGAGIRWQTACQKDVVAWFSPIEKGGLPKVPPPAGEHGGTIRERSSSRFITPPPCRFYFVTQTLSGPTDVALRLEKPDRSAPPPETTSTAPAPRAPTTGP